MYMCKRESGVRRGRECHRKMTFPRQNNLTEAFKEKINLHFIT